MIHGPCRKEGSRIHQDCGFCKHFLYGCEEYEKIAVLLRRPVIYLRTKHGNYYCRLDTDLLNMEPMENTEYEIIKEE